LRMAAVLALKINAATNSQMAASALTQLGRVFIQNNWTRPTRAITPPVIKMLTRAAPDIVMASGESISHAPATMVSRLAILDW